MRKETDIKKRLEELELESIDEFEPNFYTMNLVCGSIVKKKAIKNLFEQYPKEELIFVKNYNEIGIVEFVADNQFYIENDMIIAEEY